MLCYVMLCYANNVRHIKKANDTHDQIRPESSTTADAEIALFTVRLLLVMSEYHVQYI